MKKKKERKKGRLQEKTENDIERNVKKKKGEERQKS